MICVALCIKNKAVFHPLGFGEAGEKLQTPRLCVLQVSRKRENETYDVQRFPKVEAGSLPGIADLRVKK